MIPAVESISRSARRMVERYRPIARRTARCVFSPCWLCCLAKTPQGLYFFEEIATSIHPARQWLLLELIEKQAAKNNIQIMTTTHAPDLLTFVNDSTFENMSVVCRLEDSYDAIIRPVAELPNVRELRQGQGLGRLHESGWMENALFFTEDYHEPTRTT